MLHSFCGEFYVLPVKILKKRSFCFSQVVKSCEKRSKTSSQVVILSDFRCEVEVEISTRLSVKL